MSAVNTKSKSPESVEDILAAIEEIEPLIAENAAKGETDRRVPDEVVKALEGTGALSVTTPKRFGGLELTLEDKLAVSAAVGKIDGSTAWVVGLINVCAWLASLLPESGQQKIWGENANAHVAGVLNPTDDVKKVDGGYEISGKWPFASASAYADWYLVGMMVKDEKGETIDQGLAFAPKDQMTIDDTWYVAGMKGTGSNTLVADKAFIADDCWYSIPQAIDNEYATEHKDEILYRNSFIPFLTLILAGPQQGMGRACLDFVIEKAQKRGITYTIFEKQKDSTAFQMEISRAASMLDSSDLMIARSCKDIQDAADAGEKMPYLTRARVRADTSFAINQIRAAIDLLMTAHGAGAFADISPLQRMWRDSNVAGRHAVASPLVNQEVYGKALLGVEEQITPLV
jgi:alkylation response protein AidB-like acyl-CoA dehydrogenase